MLKEFVEKILDLGKPEVVTISGIDYSARPLHIVVPPKLFSGIALHTLQGLADAITVKLDGMTGAQFVLVVNSHAAVELIRTKTDSYGRREVLAQVSLADGELFPFNKFIPREEFVIGLQSRFVQDETTAELLRLTSSLEASTVALAEDDGISQRTTVKQGIALKEQVTVKGRRTLRPYRTFREIDQPASEFVFRLRSVDGAVPQCALFEADGGKWKLDAVLSIKAWLEAKHLGVPIVA
jgi:hypothetical protein